MYCIRKYADCWRVFNLDSDLSRSLTENEIDDAREHVVSLRASDVVSFYTDSLEWLDDKP